MGHDDDDNDLIFCGSFHFKRKLLLSHVLRKKQRDVNLIN